jgi:hypothetical protein
MDSLKISTNLALEILSKESQTHILKDLGIARIKYHLTKVITPSAARQFAICLVNSIIINMMNQKLLLILKKALRLPINFLKSLILANTGLQISDLEEIYLFKLLGDLNISPQKCSPDR